jgi:glycosyltransferase involved in cell wall biosynthesis
VAKISIIIPLYNKAGCVARAIDSILAQTFQDFEVIIVDDGSTDNGPSIIKGYDDQRLRLIQQPNAGPGAARNRGVKEANSEIVAFLDADDEFLDEFLERSLENLTNHPDCALSVVNHYRSDEKQLASEMPPCNIGIETGPWRLSPETEPAVFWGMLIYLQTWAVVCRRDIYLRFGGTYERRCNICEDQYLWLQILLNCKIYRDIKPLHWYHTENSELYGPNRNFNYTLFPFLQNPGPIRKSCPQEYFPTLEQLFGLAAALDFSTMATQCDLRQMRYLLKEFPLLTEWKKDWPIHFVKAGIKLAFPFLKPLLKVARGSARTREDSF